MPHARTPKQIRSRESFERVIDAAAALLSRGGIQGLTLAEVSRRSKVSIGSIYCRVNSKEDLIRAVQAHVLEGMDHEFSNMVNRIRRGGLPLRELVPTLVRELASFLQRHVALLNAFIGISSSDPVIATVGRKYAAQTALDFKLVLLERQSEFVHPNPEHASATSFTIVYGALARHLGLGGGRDTGANEGDWEKLIEDLGLMVLAFLAMDLRSVARSDAQR